MSGFVSHIDFRVSDVSAVLTFYDALFTALGMSKAVSLSARTAYARRDDDGVRIEWFNLYEDLSASPSPSRLAFRASDPGHVDAVYAAVAPYARTIEGPEHIERYDPTYYGVFFEDALGNKFEVCSCALRR